MLHHEVLYLAGSTYRWTQTSDTRGKRTCAYTAKWAHILAYTTLLAITPSQRTCTVCPGMLAYTKTGTVFRWVSIACWCHSSYPALLHYVYKYADNPEAGLLASTNAGGENVARGALLGGQHTSA